MADGDGNRRRTKHGRKFVLEMMHNTHDARKGAIGKIERRDMWVGKGV